MTSTSTERRPLLLGHRGARREAPENTLAAFELALAHGCDGFEFDVRRTVDGRALICHNSRLGRLEIARHPHSKLVEQRPSACCLEDVLDSFALRAWLDIELKVAGLEEAVIAALKRTPPGGGYVVSSFLADVVETVHKAAPEIPTGFICDGKREMGRWTRVPSEVFIPKDELVTRSLVEEVQAAGKKIFVWTVNQENRMRTIAEWGIDAIISDDTALLAGTLRG